MEEVKVDNIQQEQEVNKVERKPMNLEEFEEYLKNHSVFRTLTHFAGVSKFKSTNRAIKRGHLSPEGIIFPKRPFNNRANTSNRKNVNSIAFNELKKKIYARIKTTREGTA